MRAAWFCLAIACGYAQTGAPSPADQKALIARMREAAVNYGERLQDFSCTQHTVRSSDNESNGKHWKHIDFLEHQVDYVDHHERYRLLNVDGKTNDLAKRLRKGHFAPGGEFGSRLRHIFVPMAQAQFAWERTEEIGGRRACVFRYRVAEETSTLAMEVNDQAITLGHHGFVHADCDTGAVLRIEIETDPAWAWLGGRRYAVGAQVDLSYGMASIGAKEFLVPLEAVEIARFGLTLNKADIRFLNYRKYDADSSIKFETGEAKQQ